MEDVQGCAKLLTGDGICGGDSQLATCMAQVWHQWHTCAC